MVEHFGLIQNGIYKHKYKIMIISIIILVICVLFIYAAFNHVYTHEKRDNSLNKRMLNNKKSKKKNK